MTSGKKTLRKDSMYNPHRQSMLTLTYDSHLTENIMNNPTVKKSLALYLFDQLIKRLNDDKILDNCAADDLAFVIEDYLETHELNYKIPTYSIDIYDDAEELYL